MGWLFWPLSELQSEPEQCHVCKGEKTIPNDESIPSAPIIICPHCKGTGVEPEKKKAQRSSPLEDEGGGIGQDE